MFDYRSETWVDEYMSVKRLLEEESSTYGISIIFI